MTLLRKIFLSLITLTIFLRSNLIVQASPTPVFDSLTPKLQIIMRLYGETFSRNSSSNKTPEDRAEWQLTKDHVVIDGTLYTGHGGPMKLTNEDIESLYNLPFVKELDLKRFDLKDVDINKFLGINNNKTIQMVFFDNCFFDTFDDEKIKARITQKEYTVGIYPQLWIAWPGVNPDDIFYGR